MTRFLLDSCLLTYLSKNNQTVRLLDPNLFDEAMRHINLFPSVL